MSFSDPTVITINAVAKNLVRINQDKYSSEYRLRTATDDYSLNIRNSSYFDKKRGVTVDRHNVELVHTVFPVAPATLSTVRKAYFVFENQVGDTLTDPAYTAAALGAFITFANAQKMMNSES